MRVLKVLLAAARAASPGVSKGVSVQDRMHQEGDRYTAHAGANPGTIDRGGGGVGDFFTFF